MKPYYYVMIPNESTPRHNSLEEAKKKAEEVAKSRPGCSVEILQCIGISSVPNPTPSTFWLDDVETAEIQTRDARLKELEDICRRQNQTILDMDRRLCGK